MFLECPAGNPHQVEDVSVLPNERAVRLLCRGVFFQRAAQPVIHVVRTPHAPELLTGVQAPDCQLSHVQLDIVKGEEQVGQALTDEKLEVVEVLGQTALFTNGRVTEQELPDGLYRYDLREGENVAFATIERNVAANHAGTILTKAPLDFGGQEYLVFDEDTSPNFLGYDLTPEEFLQTDFTQTDAQEEDSAPQMGGLQ